MGMGFAATWLRHVHHKTTLTTADVCFCLQLLPLTILRNRDTGIVASTWSRD